MTALADTMGRDVVAGESSSKDGFLQKLDPRAKLISSVCIVMALTFVHSVLLLAASLVIAIALACVTTISLRTFTKALLPAVTITVFLGLPSIFSFFVPGDALISLGILTITRQGMYTATRFVTGASACAAWMVLLVLSTGWPGLLTALWAVRIPRVFVMVVLITYRYLFVFVRSAEEMHLAKESRTIAEKKTSSGRSWVAGRMGDLFIRSRRLSDQVYMAMTARGFTGEPKVLETSKLDTKSKAASAVAIILAVVIIAIDRLITTI